MNKMALFLNPSNFNWSLIESVAVIFSIAYVILATKQNIWCWLCATISVSLYIYICFSAQLFAETALQVFYLFMAFYGYYNWRKAEIKFKITQWSITRHLSLMLISGITIFLAGFYFTTYTSAQTPIIDSFTTVFSVFATYMVAKKVLENWIYWIVIDVVSVYLYYNRDLHLTALLFLAYTIVAIFGYFSWLKKIQHNV